MYEQNIIQEKMNGYEGFNTIEEAVEDLKKAIELNPESENMINGNYNNFSQENKVGIY